MAKANIYGEMEGYIKVNGKTIKCMERVSLPGLMEEYISGNI